MASLDPPLLLYDGDCGLCHRTVRLVLRLEREPVIRFASLQSPVGHAWAVRAGTGLETLLFVEDGIPYGRSDAVIRIARHLSRPWRWLEALRWIPRPLRDAAYDFVARRRARWFGRPTCDLPAAAHRARFLNF